MVSESIQKEVTTLTKLAPKTGESADDFSRRVAKRVNVLADKDDQNWEALSEDAQAWVNGVITADANETTIDTLSVPEGEPAEEPAPEEEASSEPAEEATEEESSVSEGKSAKKGAAKKKAAPKKAAEPKADKKVAAPKPAKAAKPAKEPKVAKAKSNGPTTRGRKSNFEPDQKIKLLVKENPHREGTKLFKMFAKYKDGMTVGELVKAGIPYSNIRYLAQTAQHIKVV